MLIHRNRKNHRRQRARKLHGDFVVDISDLQLDPTLEAAKKIAVLEHSRQPRRGYLGASQIGNVCERALWYSYVGKETEKTWKSVFAIEDGHITEDVIIDRLSKVPGVLIHSQQLGFEDMEGRFCGHIDGIICGLLQAPKTPHILEVKCCNETKFKNLIKAKEEKGEKDALEHWDVLYYAQAQVYMLKFDLDRHYLVCATPGGRDMVSVRTELDEERARNYLKRAHRIINMIVTPERIGENKDFFKCKICQFKEECWQ